MFGIVPIQQLPYRSRICKIVGILPFPTDQQNHAAEEYQKIARATTYATEQPVENENIMFTNISTVYVDKVTFTTHSQLNRILKRPLLQH